MQRSEPVSSHSNRWATWDVTKKYVFPTILGIGRVAGPTGSSIFSMSKLFQYLTNQQNSPYESAAAITAGVTTAFMNLSIRIPAMYLHHQTSNSVQPSDENDLPLTFKYQSLSIALQAVMFISTAYSSVGAFLGATGLIERIMNKTDNEIYNTDTLTTALVVTASFYIVVCNLYSNATLPLKSARNNIREFCADIQERQFPLNRNTLATALITLPGVACQPFQGYFSTSNGIMKLPYINASAQVAHAFGSVSAGTLTTYQFFTQVPSVYRKLSKKKTAVPADQKYRLDTPFSFVVKTVGLVDAVINGANMFTAITSSMHDAFEIDARNPYLIAFGITTCLSYAVMYYMFNVLENFEEVKKKFYESKNTNLYALVETDDIETAPAGTSIQNDADPAVAPSQQGLFSINNISALRSTAPPKLQTFSTPALV